MTEYSDEFFINLTMDYDERDDSIYPLWAKWCALSNDKYYIDGKDHHFYTHIRTDEEIKIERKRRELMDYAMNQRFNEHFESDEDRKSFDEKFMKYEQYIHEHLFDENVLTFNPISFEEFNSK